MNLWIRTYLAGLVVAATLTVGAGNVYAANRVVLGNAEQTSLSVSTDPETINRLDTLRQQAANKGTTRIIVGVRTAFAPEGKLNAADRKQQRKEISKKHATVLGKYPSLNNKPGKVKQFTTIPFIAMEVDAAELEALNSDADITSIEEDQLAFPTLAESVPLIGGTTAWSMGFTGAGQAVAILDTGVDKSHPFLTGKVVSEACYSATSAIAGTTSLCPGGVTQSTADGSAVPYAGACPAGQCDHGTHVAGIVAGNGATFSGIAKGASLIAIQVFTKTGTTSVGAYFSDINLGLERVYLLKDTFSIASVNMSLGGGAYSDQASCDSANLSTKAAIDNLRSVNIATVIASGNGSLTSQISSPGCISSAISVGATTKTDVVASYSNSASFLNLLAPGSSINSSIPGGAYAVYNGTSMATPHVAGAWALLKQQNVNITVSEALNALSTTGVNIIDTRNGITKPRIQIDAALNSLNTTPPTLGYSTEAGYITSGVSPSIGSATTTFTYKVIYTDTNNVPPTSIRVCIDTICHAMSKDTGAADPALRDNSYTNGEQYVYTTTLATGVHNYYFNAAHGVASASLPATGSLIGATVSDLTILTSTLPDGVVGTPYSVILLATGGSAPYSWSASGLPVGFGLDFASGVISGTPTVAGAFGFMVNVSDTSNVQYSKALSIIVPDDVTPTVPTGLIANAVSASQINLTWTASSDNVGVTAYKVYRDGILLATIGNVTSFSNIGLTALTTYSYTVAACDAAGNCSAESAAATATTSNRVPMLVAGSYHSAALHIDGTVMTWGYNPYGALGDGSTVQRNSPVVVSGLSDVVAVAAGTYNTFALKNDGTVMAWGLNGSYGQLGDGTSMNRLAPILVPGLSNIVGLDAGPSHTVAVKSDGTVMAWGYNYSGQLGDGTTTNRLSPTLVSGLSGVVAVAAGDYHTVALKSDGTVLTWGLNNVGQLGDGTAINSVIPRVVPGLSGVISVAAGSSYTIALKSDGTVVTWGLNLSGQLGDGTTNNRSVPTIVPGLNNVVAVTAGTNYMLALKSDGTVMAWGDNYYGQLGDGTSTRRLSPGVVPGVSATTAISTNFMHSAALKADGSVVAWGSNQYGQLGSGTATAGINTFTSTLGVGGVGFLNLLQNLLLETEPPSVPTGVLANAVSGTQINLSWNASTDNVGVTSYKVYRDGILQAILGSLTSFSNTGLTNVTTYSYTVAACDAAANCSVQSPAVLVTTPDSVAPSVPTGLSTTAISETQINLAWSASTDNVGVVAYKIYRSGVLIATLGNVTSYINTGLSAGTLYSYTVTACDAANNCSGQSASASARTLDNAAPTVPLGLTATAITSSQINLSWTASTDNVAVTAYKVYRDGVLQASLGNVTSYSNTGLASSTAYSYTVTACDLAGNCSAQSAAVTATTPAPDTTPPSVPVGLVATSVSASQINLSWTASTDNVGVSSYRVYRNTVQIATTVNTSFSNTGLTASTTYSYAVAACDAAGNCSTQSTDASATTPAIPVFPPNGVMPIGWVTTPGANAGWAVASDAAYEGSLSLKSGVIGHSQTASVEVTGTYPAGTISFARKVSSELNYDYLRFYIDGVLQASWSGEQAWAVVSYTVSAGTHTFRWSYTKDGSVVAGFDAAWIDAVSLPISSDTTAPSIPSGLTATAITSSQINLTWLASTDNVGVTGYRIYRNGVLVGTSSGTSYSNTGLLSGTTYSFTVAACDAASNCSAQSTAASASTPTIPVFPPNGVMPVGWVTSPGANAGWAVASDAAYEGTLSLKSGVILDNQTSSVEVTGVYPAGTVSFARKVSSESCCDYLRFYIDGIQMAAWSGEQDWAEVSYPVSAGTHTFRWSYTKDGSVSTGSDAAWIDAVSLPVSSPSDTTPPSVPADLTATAISSSQINLTWTASTDDVGVTGYKVYRNGTLLATLGNVTSYINAGLASATTYSYTVAACDAAGNCSVPSAVAAATTPVLDTTPPSIPTGLVATTAGATQINLFWTASTDNVGVTGYKVYRNGVLAGTSSGTTYNNTGLAASTTYSFTVVACDAAANCSAQSTTISATTTAASTMFYDGFEVGNINAWTIGTGAYTRAVTTSTAAAGMYSYTQTGNSNFFDGISKSLDTITPSYIGFYAKTDNITGASTYFVVGDANIRTNYGAIFFYFNSGQLFVYDGTNSRSGGAYAINTWYHIEFKNINWAAKTYDFYVDGVLKVSGIPFRSQTTTSLTSLHLYNLSSATAWYDEILMMDGTDMIAPSVPTGLAAAAISPSQINLSWTASTDNVGVTAYKVYRDGALVATLGNVTNYINTGLLSGTTYSFTVAACDAAGNCSAQSAVVSATTPMLDITPPTIPSDLVATTAGATQINLNWTASTDNVGVAAYKVYRDGALVATLGNVTNYINTGLLSGTTYSFTAAACDAAGNCSAQSAVVSATTPVPDITPPSVPVGLAATPAGASEINLSWTASTDNVSVTGYKVFRGGELAGTASGTSYRDTGLIASTTYSYTVAACDAAANCSAQSTTISATTTTASTLFYEGFEAGNINSWTLGSGPYTRTVTSSNSAAGIYSFMQTGGSLHFNGISKNFSAITPAYIGFYAKSDTLTASANTYFVVGDSNITSNLGIIFFYFGSGQLILADGTGSRSGGAYEINTWYHIEFKNINWATKTYDFYVDGALKISGIPFRSRDTTALTSIHLYNYISAAAGYDDILMTDGTDTIAPTVPNGLAAAAISSSQINLSWTASTDNVDVTAYKVYRDGSLLETLGNVTSYSNTGLSSDTTYNYTVAACDAAGNCSAQSAMVTAITLSALTLSQTSLDFAAQDMWSTSPPQSVVVTNNSITPINIYSIDSATEFITTHNCDLVLAAGTSCTVSVSFKPLMQGPVMGWIHIQSDAPPGSQTAVGLSGIGNFVPAMTLSTAVLDFAPQNMWTSSPPQSVVLTNNSFTPININGINATTEFIATHDCGLVLAAGTSCTVNVSFRPLMPGPIFGGLTIQSDAPPGSQTAVNLSGTGIFVPAMTISREALDFAPQDMWSTSPPQSVVLTNNSLTPILINGINATPEFIATHNCGLILAAGTSCTVSVSFKPLMPGPILGGMTILSDAPPGSQTAVNLSGTGIFVPAMTISAAALDFAPQDVGSSSPPQLVMVTNNSITPINVTNITTTADFALTHDCGSVLAAGLNCTISVKFTPLMAGPITSIINIQSDAPVGSQNVISLSGIGVDSVAPVVIVSVAGGVYAAPQSVSLSANEAATIYYTQDGTTPTSSSSSYTSALSVNSSMTLKYFAIDMAGNASVVQTQLYVIDTVAPTITASVTGGTYTAAQSVTLSADEPVTIYYTIDGTTPTSSSTVYISPVAISVSTTLKYFGKDAVGNTSAVQSQSYVVDSIAPVVTPSVLSGAYNVPQSVTLSTNEAATIYYTLNGLPPTTSSTVYTTPILVSATTTLKYFAKDTAGNTSVEQTQTYVIDTVAPVITPSVMGGTYGVAQSVTLSTNEPATIYYTLDGSTPTTASAIYTTPILVNSTTTLKYVGKDTVGNVSTVQAQSYVIDTVAPVVTPSVAGGTYSSGQNVTLSVNEAATIYHTMDGTTPSVGSAVYAAPIAINVSTTLKYFARDAVGNASVVQTQSYTILDVDLVMTALSTSTTSIRAGNSFSLSSTEKNIGTSAMTVNSNTVNFYLSTDANITSADTLIGSRAVNVALASGASNSATKSVTVPASLAPGTYYIGAIADATGKQIESNENNNAIVGSTIRVR